MPNVPDLDVPVEHNVPEIDVPIVPLVPIVPFVPFVPLGHNMSRSQTESQDSSLQSKSSEE